MIRVKLLTEPAYHDLCWKEKRCRTYAPSAFYDLLREKGAFTDPESIALLRHLHGETAVTEKWYARTTTDGNPCISAISPEAMYGLVVIENSRNGLYTELEDAFTEFEVGIRMDARSGGYRHQRYPLVWTAFANLEMEILLTFRIKDFGFSWEIPLEEDFILEDYPIQGVPTDVHVVQEHLREPEQRDGQWYIHNFFYDRKYNWIESREELLSLLEEDFKGLNPLATGIFSLEEFEQMCWKRDAEHEGFWPRIKDMEAQEEAQENGEPPLRVINHMAYLPEEGESRRLCLLFIEEHKDGRFRLWEETSVKYPSYEELFYEAKKQQKTDCEIFMMPVDVNEVLMHSADIHQAVCAFRVAEGVIETFGPEDGLREFTRTLRRAMDSRTYTHA